MKKEKLPYSLGCGLGGCLIGLFAGQLDTLPGALLFCLGVIFLVFCIAKVSK